jgi:hypothetical protein
MTKSFRSTSLVVLASVCSLPVWALDFTPDTTRYLSDPSFLPLQGQLYSETIYSRASRDEDWRPAGGRINEHYSADTNSYGQRFRYGLSDRLSVGASASYTDTNEHYTYLFRPRSNLDKSQLDSPTFSMTYRAIDQTDNPMSVDVEASVSPGIVDNEPRSSTVALFANRELGSVTIQGEGGAEYWSSYTTSHTLSGTPTNISSQWGYFLGARSQLRLTRGWAINSGIVYNKDLRNSLSQPAFGASYSNSAVATVTPFVTLCYDLIPGRFNLAFEYDHNFIGDESQGGSSNGAWIKQSRNLYAAHIRLLF